MPGVGGRGESVEWSRCPDCVAAQGAVEVGDLTKRQGDDDDCGEAPHGGTTSEAHSGDGPSNDRDTDAQGHEVTSLADDAARASLRHDQQGRHDNPCDHGADYHHRLSAPSRTGADQDNSPQGR